MINSGERISFWTTDIDNDELNDLHHLNTYSRLHLLLTPAILDLLEDPSKVDMSLFDDRLLQRISLDDRGGYDDILPTIRCLRHVGHVQEHSNLIVAECKFLEVVVSNGVPRISEGDRAHLVHMRKTTLYKDGPLPSLYLSSVGSHRSSLPVMDSMTTWNSDMTDPGSEGGQRLLSEWLQIVGDEFDAQKWYDDELYHFTIGDGGDMLTVHFNLNEAVSLPFGWKDNERQISDQTSRQTRGSLPRRRLKLRYEPTLPKGNQLLVLGIDS